MDLSSMARTLLRGIWEIQILGCWIRSFEVKSWRTGAKVKWAPCWLGVWWYRTVDKCKGIFFSPSLIGQSHSKSSFMDQSEARKKCASGKKLFLWHCNTFVPGWTLLNEICFASYLSLVYLLLNKKINRTKWTSSKCNNSIIFDTSSI